jgi:DNA-directed RNA polymerase specialized sigma24 family protein
MRPVPPRRQIAMTRRTAVKEPRIPESIKASIVESVVEQTPIQKSEQIQIPETQGLDVRLLDECYLAFWPTVLKFMKRKAPTREDAEDWAAGVFVSLADYYAKHEDLPSNVQGWIWRVAKNKIADFYRARAANRKLFETVSLDSERDIEDESEYDELADPGPSPEDIAVRITEIEEGAGPLTIYQRVALIEEFLISKADADQKVVFVKSSSPVVHSKRLRSALRAAKRNIDRGSR